MPDRRIAPVLVVATLLLVSLGWAVPAAPASPNQQIRLEGPIAEGIYLRERSDPGPVTSVSVEVEPDAPVAFVPVLSDNRIDGGTESTSSMCHRVGGVVCINANYAVCATCGQPFGGVVQDGVLLRSPTPFQDQVSVVNGRFTLEPWMWSAGLWSRKGGESLDFHGLNTGMNPGGTYLYTRAYGDSTGAPPGALELVVRAPKPLWTGTGQRQKVDFLALRDQGDTTIPPDGAVISAYGSSVPELRHFVELHKRVHVELVVNSPGGLEQSFAGHPVMLRDGHVQPMDPADGKVSRRHPRSIIAWNDAGRVWIVVVDGRQAHSRGMTLPEAAEHLRSLGAEHAVNFDGGGSSTMVTTCPSETGWCLRNRPSDGRERDVWVAVAVVPRGAAPAPPPPTTTTPPGPPSRPADPEGGPDEAELWTSAPAPDARSEATSATPERPTATTTTTSTTTTAPPPVEAEERGTTTVAQAPPTSTPVSVIPAGDEAVAAGGLVPSERARTPVGAVAAAVLLVAAQSGALVWFVRRRRRRRAWARVLAPGPASGF